MQSPKSTAKTDEAPLAGPLVTSSSCHVGSATAPPNRSLARPGQRRSRRMFSSRKSRLTLTIDDSTAEASSLPAGQSTPVSTSSSCSSDVVPWWEVEYQCPPPGHLGAHVVPVSALEQAAFPQIQSSESNLHTTPAVTADVQVQSDTLTETVASPSQKPDAIRPGLVAFETPERVRRPINKLKALVSTPCCTCRHFCHFLVVFSRVTRLC